LGDRRQETAAMKVSLNLTNFSWPGGSHGVDIELARVAEAADETRNHKIDRGLDRWDDVLLALILPGEGGDVLLGAETRTLADFGPSSERRS
jgi:hypothetical protein